MLKVIYLEYAFVFVVIRSHFSMFTAVLKIIDVLEHLRWLLKENVLGR